MKTVKQFIALAFAAMIIVSCGGGGSSSDNENSDNAKKPETKEETQMTADLENGKEVYNKVCIACHLTGVAGAAKISDKKRWQEVAPKGLKTLHQSVINGVPDGKYGVMPERGSCTDCTDKDLYDAAAYIFHEAGVEVKK